MGRRSDGPHEVIAQIETNRADHNISYTTSCRALDVSESWFYANRDREPTDTELRRQRLDEAVEALFGANDGEYGSPRIHAELIETEEFVSLSVNTVAASMRRLGLVAKAKPKRRCLTRPGKTAPKFPNLLKRDFDPTEPNVAWVGDITEITTWEGKLYLATVIDLFSRRLIGFAIAEHCRAQLVCDAMCMAIATRGGTVTGVIFHSDRGSQADSIGGRITGLLDGA